jgi:hypothetical protein
VKTSGVVMKTDEFSILLSNASAANQSWRRLHIHVVALVVAAMIGHASEPTFFFIFILHAMFKISNSSGAART